MISSTRQGRTSGESLLCLSCIVYHPCLNGLLAAQAGTGAYALACPIPCELLTAVARREACPM